MNFASDAPVTPPPATTSFPGTSHPLRETLLNELHARPFQSLTPPTRLSHLIVLGGETIEAQRAQHAHFARLCKRYSAPPPAEEAKNFVQNFGPFRIRWERHAEFAAYTFIREEAFDHPFEDPVINLVPRDWLDALPGKVLVAAHVAVEDKNSEPRDAAVLSRLFDHNHLIGCGIAGGNAMMWTDLRADANGFCRFLIRDVKLYDRQAGRAVQRLLEVHAYTALSLLALPVAQEAVPMIARNEALLADITGRLRVLGDISEERGLLGEITALAADIERIEATTSYRYGASAAYYELVRARLAELREQRIHGYQRLTTFLDRRLCPAMRTCEATAIRQRALAARIARASNLLRTRVDVALESQNQELLQSMNRRASLQLRLQTTVEGLSVAAISYYIVGLIGYAAKALKSVGFPIDPNLASGLAIPVVVGILWMGVRHVRRIATREERSE